MIEVVSSCCWEIHWGGINRLGGLQGQLSKCLWNGMVTCYVRENVALDHFNMSGGERQALKRGDVSKRFPQVLELCAPAEHWDKIARAAEEADALHRRVRRNRNFSAAWAERQLEKKSD